MTIAARAVNAVSSPAVDADRTAIGRWLAFWAAMVALLVLIGGATRLTESGLSITEWKPVSGVVPPLSATAWAEEFSKYRQIPQYRLRNAGMTLGEFKTIFLWEYAHRLWARLVGVALLVPLVWFAARRRLPRAVRSRLVALLALLGAQGAMGWWMVASGLSERTSVSQYRLAAHLAMALVIYLWTVWMSADLLDGRPAAAELLVAPAPSARVALASLTALAFVTALSGAFVAGLRAGKIYNTFPTMGAGLVPPEYGQLVPWWKNVFENPSAVQFNHRVLASTTVLAAVAVWFACGRLSDAGVARSVRLVLAAAVLQATLGVSALLLGVPVWLGVAHQGGALLFLTMVLLAWRASRRRVEWRAHRSGSESEVRPDTETGRA